MLPLSLASLLLLLSEIIMNKYCRLKIYCENKLNAVQCAIHSNLSSTRIKVYNLQVKPDILTLWITVEMSLIPIWEENYVETFIFMFIIIIQIKPKTNYVLQFPRYCSVKYILKSACLNDQLTESNF